MASGSFQSGTSHNCYIYINKIEQDYYTNIYVTSEKARDEQTSSNEYIDIALHLEKDIR